MDIIENANSFKSVQKEEDILSETKIGDYLFILLLFSTQKYKSQALGT